MELIGWYLAVGLALFALGLIRLEESAWLGIRAVPELFFLQLITFVLFWPVLLAVELNQR